MFLNPFTDRAKVARFSSLQSVYSPPTPPPSHYLAMSKVSKWGKVKEAVVHRTLRGPELIQAVKDGDVAVVQTLLENGRVDPNSTDHKSKSTALHFAALRGHTDVIILLCKAGADVRATTPLHKVSALHRYVAVTCCGGGA